MTRPLRLAVTLSGGASLGAYQAGVVAGLLVAANALRDHATRPWVVDGFGGGSAGAMVSLLAATVAVRGVDPVHLLREAWVEQVDTGLLGASGGQAPLDFQGFADAAIDLFERAPADQVAAPPAPVVLHVALTGLRGLTYPVPGLRGDDTVRATTYVDWSRFRLEPEVDLHEVFDPGDRSPLAAALASAANPGAFAPRLLDRGPLLDEYRARGVDDLPDSGHLWYTDGALVQSEPVGRLLEALGDLGDAGDDDRMVLLVDPRSEGPTTGDAWADPDRRPHWLDGLQRALAILPAHVLYEDLRRIERDNARLAWVDEAVERLAPHLDDDAPLAEILADIDGHRDDRRPGEPDTDGAGRHDGAAAAGLRRLLERVAGLSGKRPVTVDVLSPLLLADDGQGVPALLAGEILGDFGGFLDRDLRNSDFTLGYATTSTWLRDALPALDYDPSTVERVTAEVDGRHEHDWRDVNRGQVEPGDLSWPVRLRALRLSGRFARALAGQVVGDALPWPSVARDLVRRLRRS